jgi:hypothetical protein
MSIAESRQGWWQASDGNWYPPELHPNAAPTLPPPPAAAPAPALPNQAHYSGFVAAPPTAKKPKKRKWVRVWAIALAVLFALVLIAVVAGPSDPSTEQPNGDASGSTATWEDRLREDAEDSSSVEAWGGIVVDGSSAVVTIVSSENLTEGLTKDSARLAVSDVVQAAQGAALPPEVASVVVVVRYDLVNQFGEVAEDDVIVAPFSRETVDRLQFDNLDPTEILRAADQGGLWVHPAFAYSDGS